MHMLIPIPPHVMNFKALAELTPEQLLFALTVGLAVVTAGVIAGILIAIYVSKRI